MAQQVQAQAHRETPPGRVTIYLGAQGYEVYAHTYTDQHLSLIMDLAQVREKFLDSFVSYDGADAWVTRNGSTFICGSVARTSKTGTALRPWDLQVLANAAAGVLGKKDTRVSTRVLADPSLLDEEDDEASSTEDDIL